MKEYSILFTCKSLKENNVIADALINSLDIKLYPDKIIGATIETKEPKSIEIEGDRYLIQNIGLGNILIEKVAVLYNKDKSLFLSINRMKTYFTQPSFEVADCSIHITAKHIASSDDLYYFIKSIISVTQPFILNVDDEVQNYDYSKHETHGLPVLADIMMHQIDPWFTPQMINWINYWDKDIAKKCGVKYEEDKNLFYKSEQLNDGGILFQITETPPDVDNPEHLETLQAIYKRYPLVGGQYLAKQ